MNAQITHVYDAGREAERGKAIGKESLMSCGTRTFPKVMLS